METPRGQPVLRAENLAKQYGPVTVLSEITLDIFAGEIHAIIGENGAGKSTLMRLLAGYIAPNAGGLRIDGQSVAFATPHQAQDAGIVLVHQEILLADGLTVADNLFLGREPVRNGTVDDRHMWRVATEKLAELGCHIAPDALVRDVPLAERQLVQIARALLDEHRVVIFDEPTAVLTPQETDELMAIMRQLKEAGTSIVFITHKLREVREVADRITVIRRGKVVGEASPSATNTELASLMVGRAVELTVHKDEPKLGHEALVVRDLSVIDARHQLVVNHVSFEVKAGEVLVIAGVQGNGQTDLIEALMGLQARVTGSIELNGTSLRGLSVRKILDAGVGFVPEDRTEDGLVAGFTVAENLMLDRSTSAPFVKAGTLQRGYLAEFAREKVTEFDIRTQGIDSLAGQLSGGNQQKVVLARELSRELHLLVATQPTRGLDVGSIEFVHKRIIATRDAGIPVIVVSTELDEVVALADRIAVMYRGGIVGIVPGTTPRSVLGLMMTGEPAPETEAAA